MANQKKLQQATIKFRKQNAALYNLCEYLLSGMAKFIIKSGASEVTVGIDKCGKYYERTNQQY